MDAIHDEVEKKYLGELIKEVEQENKLYYEQKAKDMMRRSDGNLFIQTCTNLLLQASENISEDTLRQEIKLEKEKMPNAADESAPNV